VLAFNLRLDGQKLLAPPLAAALGAFVNRVAHGETVIALPALIAGKLLALAAAPDLAFHLSAAVLFIQHVFARNTHGLLLIRNTLPQLPRGRLLRHAGRLE